MVGVKTDDQEWRLTKSMAGWMDGRGEDGI